MVDGILLLRKQFVPFALMEDLTAITGFLQGSFGLFRTVRTIGPDRCASISGVKQLIEYLAVMHRRIGDLVIAYQLVLVVYIDMVLVTIVTLAVFLGPARFDILLNLGRLHKDKLDAPDRARAYLAQARQIQASHAELNALLTDLFAEAGDWSGLKAVLVSEYDSTKNPSERYETALALAKLHRGELADTTGFMIWIKKAQEDGRQRREVEEMLIDYHIEREAWPEVVSKLEWLVN